MANPIENLHKQLKRHLDTIKELRMKLLDVENERDKLAAYVARLEKDNKWLETELFDKGETGR